MEKVYNIELLIEDLKYIYIYLLEPILTLNNKNSSPTYYSENIKIFWKNLDWIKLRIKILSIVKYFKLSITEGYIYPNEIMKIQDSSSYFFNLFFIRNVDDYQNSYLINEKNIKKLRYLYKEINLLSK